MCQMAYKVTCSKCETQIWMFFLQTFWCMQVMLWLLATNTIKIYKIQKQTQEAQMFNAENSNLMK